MSSRSRSLQLLTLMALCLVVPVAANAEPLNSPSFGREMSEADVNAVSTTIFPDGAGLPSGSGTAVQGKAIYDAECSSCHGETGAGEIQAHVPALSGPPINGSTWSMGTSWPYATSVFDYVRRAMPPHSVKELSANDVYSVTAYILHLNGLVEFGERLDGSSLPKVRMPAAEYFSSKWIDVESRYNED